MFAFKHQKEKMKTYDYRRVYMLREFVAIFVFRTLIISDIPHINHSEVEYKELIK